MTLVAVDRGGMMVFSGPVENRAGFQSALMAAGYRVLPAPPPGLDGVTPHPGHGLPSYPDPITAAAAGAPNSGHTPGTLHPATLRFVVGPGQTEERPNPVAHHGEPYEEDARIGWTTVEAAALEPAVTIAGAHHWTLRLHAPPSRHDTDEEPVASIIARIERDLEAVKGRG